MHKQLRKVLALFLCTTMLFSGCSIGNGTKDVTSAVNGTENTGKAEDVANTSVDNIDNVGQTQNTEGNTVSLSMLKSDGFNLAKTLNMPTVLGTVGQVTNDFIYEVKEGESLSTKVVPIQYNVSWNTPITLPEEVDGYVLSKVYSSSGIGLSNGRMGCDIDNTKTVYTFEELYDMYAKVKYADDVEMQEVSADLKRKAVYMTIFVGYKKDYNIIWYAIPFTIADYIDNDIQVTMTRNKELTFNKDIEYHILESRDEYLSEDEVRLIEKLSSITTVPIFTNYGFGALLYEEAGNILTTNRDHMQHEKYKSEGQELFATDKEYMERYVDISLKDNVGALVKHGTKILYRSIDGDKRSQWNVIDLGQYASNVVDSVAFRSDDRTPKAGDIKQVTSSTIFLTCFPEYINVTYCDGSVREEAAHYDFYSDEENTVINLTPPGQAQIGDYISTGYSLEWKINNGSLGFLDSIGSGAFGYIEFNETLSEEDCLEYISALTKRQSLIEIKNSELMGTQTQVFYTDLRESFDLSVYVNGDVMDSVPITEDVTTENSDTVSITESVTEMTTETESSVETTESVVETTIETVTEGSEVNTTEQIDDNTDKQELEDLIKNFKVDMGFAELSVNADDPAMLLIGANELAGNTEFMIPLSYFHIDDCFMTNGELDSKKILVAAILQTHNNPLAPTLADMQLGLVEVSGVQYVVFQAVYGESLDYLAKWQEASYTKAVQVANEINAKNLDTTEKAIYLNQYLLDNGTYNHTAFNKATAMGSSVKDILKLSEEEQAAWAPYGILCLGTGVCQSYAESYKLIADMIGLETICVTGPGHIWNKVNIDGTWYLMDATNNDSEMLNGIMRNSLCLSTDEFAESMTGVEDDLWTLQDKAIYRATDDSKHTFMHEHAVKSTDIAGIISAEFDKGGAFVFYLTDTTVDSNKNTLSVLTTGGTLSVSNPDDLGCMALTNRLLLVYHNSEVQVQQQ